MKTAIASYLLLVLAGTACTEPGRGVAADTLAQFPSDTIETSDGPLTIYFIGHATLMLKYKNLVIHVDPVNEFADYKKMPKADLILVTHEHYDHFDAKAIAAPTKKGTALVLNNASGNILKAGQGLENGDSLIIQGIRVKAIPAYNTTTGRDKFHPRGRDNGYLLSLGGKNIYIAGDTEDIPEMAELKNIDIAFLPMNQPYTMTPEQLVNAVKMIKPKIVYPYHYGATDLSGLPELLKDQKQTELRIRPMK
ncbi:MBL fold metallo-hydrolase [candidate division TA06 bacterium]|uniref:MBL fold metallo-hydrolase n=1 Tax=candidate division TA06 bacterium TaxID=2250710 RepID=A0A933IEQ2_UNCT6|nr:MBL fold metallo-hydrolase [candidate division TA06 bacterium]